LIDAFAEDVVALPFDAAAAALYGKVAATHVARGTPIGSIDTLIVAHALSVKVTLVTNNARHCSRIAKLADESWL
jgi:tRNA(fMet)-specific endonuclease VapC